MFFFFITFIKQKISNRFKYGAAQLSIKVETYLVLN